MSDVQCPSLEQKKMRFPKKKEIDNILKNIKDDDYSESLSSNATPIERTKFKLCEKFIKYLNKEICHRQNSPDK